MINYNELCKDELVTMAYHKGLYYIFVGLDWYRPEELPKNVLVNELQRRDPEYNNIPLQSVYRPTVHCDYGTRSVGTQTISPGCRYTAQVFCNNDVYNLSKADLDSRYNRFCSELIYAGYDPYYYYK